jgi:hypothetical protein
MRFNYRISDTPENRLLAGSLAGVFGNILIWPLLARSSSLADLGILSLSLAVVAGLAPILLFGNNVTAVVSVNRLSEPGNRAMSTSGLLSLWRLLLMATSILLLVSFFASNFYSNLAAYCATQTGFILSLALLRRFGEYLYFFVFNIFALILGNLSLAFLVEWNFLPIQNFLTALSTWQLVSQIILFSRIRRKHEYHFELKNLFKSMGLLPHLVLYIVIVQGGKYLISIRLSADELGRYQVLSVYAAGLLTLVIVSSPYLFDELAQSDDAANDIQFERMYLKVKRLIVTIVALTLIFFALTVVVHINQSDMKTIIQLHLSFLTASLIQIRNDYTSVFSLRLTKYFTLGLSSIFGVSISLIVMFLIDPTILIGSYFVCTALFVKMIAVRYFSGIKRNNRSMPLLDNLTFFCFCLLVFLAVI